MIKQNQFFNVKNIVVALIIGVVVSTLMVTDANAEGRKRIYSLSAIKAKKLVANNLAGTLRNDLSNPNINFQVRNVEVFKVEKNQITMKGDGYCVLTKSNDKMPMKFETIIDARSNELAKVKYNFVDFNESKENSINANEDNLMTALLKKFSKDYKTENIVVAIDSVKGLTLSSSKKSYTGFGDVKIKNGSWKSVEFTIELNADNKTAKSVVYKLK